MSKKIAHIKQAKHNEQVAWDLLAPQLRHFDWSVVAIFYSSVHYVESSWAEVGIHSRDHDERKALLEKHHYKDYELKLNCKILQGQGWIARYLSDDRQNEEEAQNFFNDESITKLFERLEIIKNRLSVV